MYWTDFPILYAKVNDIYIQLLIHISAPFVKDVGLKYEIVAFNGSLLRENVFRQDAGPEVDAAWTSLGVDCEPSR